VLGYVYDLGVLLLALAVVAAFVTPEARERARKRIVDLLGTATPDVDGN
jgi:hypothetical protein